MNTTKDPYRFWEHERLIVVIEVPNGDTSRRHAYTCSLSAQLLMVNLQGIKATIGLHTVHSK